MRRSSQIFEHQAGKNARQHQGFFSAFLDRPANRHDGT